MNEMKQRCLAMVVALASLHTAAAHTYHQLPAAAAPAGIAGVLRPCTRAGGTFGTDAAADSARAVAPWEDEEHCVQRGCQWMEDGCFHTVRDVAIKTVHLIQSNHLDVGYTDNAVNVINKYFDLYFPRAAGVGAQLRSLGGPERLKWMTQSYLISLFLDCPPGIGLHCPAPDAVSNFTAAVAAGDIVWQAFPHNAELMMVDKLMLQFGIEMVSRAVWWCAVCGVRTQYQYGVVSVRVTAYVAARRDSGRAGRGGSR